MVVHRQNPGPGLLLTPFILNPLVIGIRPRPFLILTYARKTPSTFSGVIMAVIPPLGPVGYVKGQIMEEVAAEWPGASVTQQRGLPCAGQDWLPRDPINEVNHQQSSSYLRYVYTCIWAGIIQINELGTGSTSRATKMSAAAPSGTTSIRRLVVSINVCYHHQHCCRSLHTTNPAWRSSLRKHTAFHIPQLPPDILRTMGYGRKRLEPSPWPYQHPDYFPDATPPVPDRIRCPTDYWRFVDEMWPLYLRHYATAISQHPAASPDDRYWCSHLADQCSDLNWWRKMEAGARGCIALDPDLASRFEVGPEHLRYRENGTFAIDFRLLQELRWRAVRNWVRDLVPGPHWTDYVGYISTSQPSDYRGTSWQYISNRYVSYRRGLVLTFHARLQQPPWYCDKLGWVLSLEILTLSSTTNSTVGAFAYRLSLPQSDKTLDFVSVLKERYDRQLKSTVTHRQSIHRVLQRVTDLRLSFPETDPRYSDPRALPPNDVVAACLHKLDVLEETARQQAGALRFETMRTRSIAHGCALTAQMGSELKLERCANAITIPIIAHLRAYAQSRWYLSSRPKNRVVEKIAKQQLSRAVKHTGRLWYAMRHLFPRSLALYRQVASSSSSVAKYRALKDATRRIPPTKDMAQKMYGEFLFSTAQVVFTKLVWNRAVLHPHYTQIEPVCHIVDLWRIAWPKTVNEDMAPILEVLPDFESTGEEISETTLEILDIVTALDYGRGTSREDRLMNAQKQVRMALFSATSMAKKTREAAFEAVKKRFPDLWERLKDTQPANGLGTHSEMRDMRSAVATANETQRREDAVKAIEACIRYLEAARFIKEHRHKESSFPYDEYEKYYQEFTTRFKRFQKRGVRSGKEKGRSRRQVVVRTYMIGEKSGDDVPPKFGDVDPKAESRPAKAQQSTRKPWYFWNRESETWLGPSLIGVTVALFGNALSKITGDTRFSERQSEIFKAASQHPSKWETTTEIESGLERVIKGGASMSMGDRLTAETIKHIAVAESRKTIQRLGDFAKSKERTRDTRACYYKLGAQFRRRWATHHGQIVVASLEQHRKDTWLARKKVWAKRRRLKNSKMSDSAKHVKLTPSSQPGVSEENGLELKKASFKSCWLQEKTTQSGEGHPVAGSGRSRPLITKHWAKSRPSPGEVMELQTVLSSMGMENPHMKAAGALTQNGTGSIHRYDMNSGFRLTKIESKEKFKFLRAPFSLSDGETASTAADATTTGGNGVGKATKRLGMNELILKKSTGSGLYQRRLILKRADEKVMDTADGDPAPDTSTNASTTPTSTTPL